MEAYLTQLSALAVDFGGKLLGAIALWFIGKWLIRLAHRLLAASLKRQTVDDTLARYIGSTTDVLLNIILVIAVLVFSASRRRRSRACSPRRASRSAWHGRGCCRILPLACSWCCCGRSMSVIL